MSAGGDYVMLRDVSERPSAEKVAIALARYAAVRGQRANWVRCSPLDAAALGPVGGVTVYAMALYHPGVFAVGRAA